MSHIPFPVSGTPASDLIAQMGGLAAHDADWRNGRTFSLVFYPGPEVEALMKTAYTRFMFENGLSPASFRSLGRMESEVVSMTASLLNAPESAVGNMTSGGTESILCAVRAALKHAAHRIPKGRRGNLVMPATAHPAFNKAADYFGLELRAVKCAEGGLLPDMADMAAALDDATVLMVGSAPAYPHGLIDPLDAMSAMALAHNIWLHVDACVGGYLIPFIEQMGEPVPQFDFRLPGVSSISLDLHKYGYAAKGSSVVMYRHVELRKGQYYVYSEWPGGLYASPTVSGTRPGGGIAAAWAVMRFLGREGYAEHARHTLDAARRIQVAVGKTEGLAVTGNPLLPIFSIRSTGRIDIFRLGDALSAKGWHLDRQLEPASLHLSVSFGNVPFIDEFITDLHGAVLLVSGHSLENIADGAAQRIASAAARFLPESWVRKATQRSIASIPKKKEGTGRTAPLYGMVGELSGKGTIDAMLIELLDAMNRPSDESLRQSGEGEKK
ncbi:MAG: aminotransferase class V-fold PLP-dependent enzyme [Flavobacteriales bacterium]|nr:aminotransferase class V-fold PLP-dependent enzyme [Flavobacteriales bacterium]